MKSRSGIIAAAVMTALLALTDSTWAEGVVMVDGQNRIALVAVRDGSGNWTGSGVASGFQSSVTPVRVETWFAEESSNGLVVIAGFLSDWPGWVFVVFANPITGDYRAGYVHGLGLFVPTIFGTGTVRILP